MSDNQLITKSNVLIQQSVDELNQREQYLMAILLSEFKAANPKATCLAEMQTDTITIKLTEFINYLGLNKDSGRNIDNYKNTIAHFQSRAFFVWLDDKYANRTPMFSNIQIPKHWVDDGVPFDEKEYDINFKFHEIFIENLLCSSNFTELFKRSIIHLKSEKAIKLYQLLKSHAAQEFDTTYSVSDLRLRLGMTSKSYDVFKDFFKRGIADPVKEINENTEIFVKVVKNKSKKDKRIIESITFKIRNQAEKKVWWEYDFPKVKLTDDEYREVSKWVYPVHHKQLVKELQEKLDEGVDIRNHYKWLNGRYKNKLESAQTRLF